MEWLIWLVLTGTCCSRVEISKKVFTFLDSGDLSDPKSEKKDTMLGSRTSCCPTAGDIPWAALQIPWWSSLEVMWRSLFGLLSELFFDSFWGFQRWCAFGLLQENSYFYGDVTDVIWTFKVDLKRVCPAEVAIRPQRSIRKSQTFNRQNGVDL